MSPDTSHEEEVYEQVRYHLLEALKRLWHLAYIATPEEVAASEYRQAIDADAKAAEAAHDSVVATITRFFEEDE